MNYKLLKNGVQRLSDNAFIPPSIDNLDWKEYQKWRAAGGIPQPMDIEPVVVIVKVPTLEDVVKALETALIPIVMK